jgi:hypothetical protein
MLPQAFLMPRAKRAGFLVHSDVFVIRDRFSEWTLHHRQCRRITAPDGMCRECTALVVRWGSSQSWSDGSVRLAVEGTDDWFTAPVRTHQLKTAAVIASNFARDLFERGELPPEAITLFA